MRTTNTLQFGQEIYAPVLTYFGRDKEWWNRVGYVYVQVTGDTQGLEDFIKLWALYDPASKRTWSAEETERARRFALAVTAWADKNPNMTALIS